MVSPDCARSRLEKMCQNEGESVAQYHLRLWLQVAKCRFTDPDDVIRSKILQTMRDKKLRREAMVKRYTLQQLLEHVANKEDIDRQAQHMEERLPSAPSARNQVNKVHQKKHQRPKELDRHVMTRRTIPANSAVGPQRPSVAVPSLWKKMWFLLKEGSFRSHVQREKETKGFTA